MLCAHPFMIGSMQCRCGGSYRNKDGSRSVCLPCLKVRRRMWTGRMLLELQKHRDAAFVTLTYDEDNLPAGGSLVPGDARNWLKRLRYSVSPGKLRYFLVGEYGEETQRPHYHAALFGYAGCVYGRSQYSDVVEDCCRSCDLVRDTWSMGNVVVGELNAKSVAYVCGYVTKKMTGRDDVRLRGREPEFARMSLRPGLGAVAVGDLARSLESDVGLDSIAESGDVPGALRYSGQLYPLGRYIRGELRKELGICGDTVAKENAKKAVREMQRVYEEDVVAAKASSRSVAEIRVDRLRQKLLNTSVRFELDRQRKGGSL